MKKLMETMGMNTKGPKQDAPKAKPAAAKQAPKAEPKIAEV